MYIAKTTATKPSKVRTLKTALADKRPAQGGSDSDE